MKNFETIYTEYRDKIFNHVSFRIKNKEQAEDLTQEIFIKVYKNLAMYDESKGQFSTWIYAIATNVVIDYYRQKKLETSDMSMFISEDGMELSNIVHCTKENPENVLIQKEISDNVQKNIKSLPRNLRRTAKLFFNANLNYNEIADALDIPLGTVKNNIFRAREILQDNLKHVHEYTE